MAKSFTTAIEGVVLAAPMAQGVVLHPSAGGVHAARADGNHVERIGHGSRLGEVAGQRRSERLVQIAHRDGHRRLPPLGLVDEPSVQVRGLAHLDQVDHFAALHVADARHPPSPLGGGGGEERRLVHPDGRRDTNSVGMLDEHLSPQGDGVHHRTP